MGLVAAMPWMQDIGELEGVQRDDAVTFLVREHRRITAELAAMVAAVDTSASYTDDGHSCTRAWLQAVTNSSKGDAQEWVSTARTLRDLPRAAESLADGRLGTSQLAELVALRRNPRCRGLLPECDESLTEAAEALRFEDFHTACTRWKMMADPDGNRRDHERADAARTASAAVVGAEFLLRANGGALDGAEIIEILDGFAEAEFQADWADLVARSGDGAPTSMLARTVGQRRFDALLRIFRTAASATGIGIKPDGSIVNFVIDPQTFVDEVRHAAGLPTDPADLTTFMSRRCETTNGISVHPEHVVAAAMLGRVRRIVVDGAGIVVDAGRLRRFFTGALRDVIQATTDRCWWPGCDVPAGRSQLDHADPFHTNGATSSANANIACGRHNRMKEHGYRAWRDPAGQWHTYRPNGTEIAPRHRP